MQYRKRKKLLESETELAPSLIFQKSLEKKKCQCLCKQCTIYITFLNRKLLQHTVVLARFISFLYEPNDLRKIVMISYILMG